MTNIGQSYISVKKRKMRTKSSFFAVLVVLFASIIISGCEKDDNGSDSQKGGINLYITDAPIDFSEIEGVYITFTEIQYHDTGDGNWYSFDEFDGPVTINLLDYTRGESSLLGFFEMPAGNYSQIRFMLQAPERGQQGPPQTPGSYLEFIDGTTTSLFVPSGSQSGFKGVGSFSVSSTGITEITADFDVRRSVVKAGASGRYILKPVIRLIVSGESGRIRGEVTNIPEETDITVYAYEHGTYTSEEAAEPVEEEVRFPNAVNSDMVDEQNIYHLDFLAGGSYDLVVGASQDGEFIEVIGVIESVEVVSGETTNQPIDIDEL